MSYTCSSTSVGLLWLLTVCLVVISVATFGLFVQFVRARIALPANERGKGKRLFQLGCGQYSMTILRNVFQLLHAWHPEKKQETGRIGRVLQSLCVLGISVCALLVVTEGLNVFQTSTYAIPTRTMKWFYVGIATFPLLLLIAIVLNLWKPVNNVSALTAVFIVVIALDFVLVYSSLSHAFISRLIALVSERSAFDERFQKSPKAEDMDITATSQRSMTGSTKMSKTLSLAKRVRSTSVDAFDATNRDTLRLASKYSVLVAVIGICGVLYGCGALLANVGFPIRGCVRPRIVVGALIASISMTAGCVCTHVAFSRSQKHYEMFCAKADSLCRNVAAYRAAANAPPLVLSDFQAKNQSVEN